MDDWMADRVAAWERVSVDDGMVGVCELAAEGFSGVIEGDGDQLVLVNGQVVSANGEPMDAIDAPTTAFRAPDPGVALLAAMLGEGEAVDRGYTEELPYEAVHDRLSGGFSGFLCLSEYVLSGDYYVVYHGDRAFPVAYVGAAERLHTGSAALALASDEVGIYEVRQVGLSAVPVDAAASAGG